MVACRRFLRQYQIIPGKGQWETATLERADQGLAPLLTALRRPNQTRPLGTFCSDLVELPPQFVLVGKDEFLKANAAAIKAFLEDLHAATKFYLERSKEARQILIDTKMVRVPADTWS